MTVLEPLIPCSALIAVRAANLESILQVCLCWLEDVFMLTTRCEFLSMNFTKSETRLRCASLHDWLCMHTCMRDAYIHACISFCATLQAQLKNFERQHISTPEICTILEGTRCNSNRSSHSQVPVEAKVQRTKFSASDAQLVSFILFWFTLFADMLVGTLTKIQAV